MPSTAELPAIHTADRPGPGRASQSGVWIAIFAIIMSFAAFTSALFIRQASSDWTHLAVPPILFVNSVLLFFSSLTLELPRRKLEVSPEPDSLNRRKSKPFIILTLLLVLFFLAGQYFAWRQLAAHGLYLATNPNSSFFYLFTGLHAIHLLGGIVAMLVLLLQVSSNLPFRRNLYAGVTTYWHFMGALWFYLLIVICTRL